MDCIMASATGQIVIEHKINVIVTARKELTHLK